MSCFDGVKINYINSVEDAAEFMRWLGERRTVLAFDTETEGLHYWSQNCRLAQFGDARTGWVIPFERWSGVVEEVFKKYTEPITGHNIRFDARFMWHHGIDVGMHRLHDTMLSANAVWPNDRLSLKHLASTQLDPGAAQGEAALADAMSAGHWNWATVPLDLPQYWGYAGLDTVLSAQLFEHIDPLLDREGVRGVYDLECAVSAALFKMETRGAAIDVPFSVEKFHELRAYADSLREWAQSQYGVSLGSNAQLIQVLRNEGVTFTKRTKSGKSFALDEEVLSSIDHPLAQSALNMRKSEKVASAYFGNFIQLNDNGRLHCSVKQVGARTGRMSITEPALQTLPRDNKIVRAAFRPYEGDKLVSIDYSQIEMRIFAHFAQEEEMIKRIRAGINLHRATAQVVYGTEDVTLEQYTRMKNTNFSKVYGAGSTKFAATAGITEQEGAVIYDAYDRAFPGVKVFMNQVGQVAKRRLREEGRAYVREMGGRLHVVDNEDEIYKLTNHLIQGTAATVLKEKIVALDLSGFGDHMVLPIHDEVMFSFPEDDATEMTLAAVSVMEDRDRFLVPLEVDASQPMDRWEKS